MEINKLQHRPGQAADLFPPNRNLQISITSRARFFWLLTGLAALLLTPSIAVAKPRVTLTLPEADAGIPVRYFYTTSQVPSRAKLVLQRQVGTAKRFKTVATLAHTRSNSGNLPALDLGKHKLRIAAIERRRVKRKIRTVVLAQQKRTLTVFGTVSFSMLFKRAEQTFTTPTRSFSFVFYDIFVRDLHTIVTVDSSENLCRSVHVDWVAGGSDTGDKSETGIVSLIQEARDAVTDTALWGDISALDAVVTPGQSWGINISSQGSNDLNFYVNGTASCYSHSLV